MIDRRDKPVVSIAQRRGINPATRDVFQNGYSPYPDRSYPTSSQNSVVEQMAQPSGIAGLLGEISILARWAVELFTGNNARGFEDPIIPQPITQWLEQIGGVAVGAKVIVRGGSTTSVLIDRIDLTRHEQERWPWGATRKQVTSTQTLQGTTINHQKEPERELTAFMAAFPSMGSTEPYYKEVTVARPGLAGLLGDRIRLTNVPQSSVDALEKDGYNIVGNPLKTFPLRE